MGVLVCLTLPPIPDNKINLHSSTLMKVPRHLFSSLSHSLFLRRMASPELKIGRDNQALKGQAANFTHENEFLRDATQPVNTIHKSANFMEAW